MSTIYCAAARTQLSPLPINTFSASLPARKWRECSRRSHCRFSIILFLQVGASESPELNGTTVPFSALEVPDYQGPNRDPRGISFHFVPFRGSNHEWTRESTNGEPSRKRSVMGRKIFHR